ncbi:MAG: Chromate resistance protein ChrB [Bacilli bacterium]
MDGAVAPFSWLLLIYSLPAHPTNKRVYVWRKLKQLGAVYLVDSVSALPYTERHREHLQWIAAEIVEMGGGATYFQASSLGPQQDAQLRRQFEEQATERYTNITESLDKWEATAHPPSIEAEDTLRRLTVQFRLAFAQDFFHSATGATVRHRLERLLCERSVERGGDDAHDDMGDLATSRD